MDRCGTSRSWRHYGEVVLNLAQSQYIYRLPESMVGSNAAYLDILPNDEGYNHIALFSPADSSVPKWLTRGSWEVTSGVLGVDVDKAIVYVWTPGVALGTARLRS